MLRVSSQGVLPLVSAIHLSGKVPAPVPHLAAYWLVDALYATGLVEAPSGFIDYVRYPCIADGAKAERALGFTATYSSRHALDAYIAYRHPLAERDEAAAGEAENGVPAHSVTTSTEGLR